MMVSVNAKGHLEVDGVQMKVEDLTQDFLEKLVDDSLESKVNYEIDGDMPLAQFFRKIEEGTKEGSELRVLKEETEKKERDEVQRGEVFAADVADTPTSDILR